MTWSNGSTSRSDPAGRPYRVARTLSLFVAALLVGCHAAKPPAPLVPAYADLNVLVQRHPGWGSVAQYDAMLARLRTAIRQTRATGAVPETALGLPAQSGLDLPGAAYTLPAPALQEQQRQLAAQEQAQVARLRARRASARVQQLDLQQARWRREAELRYAQAAQAAQARFVQRRDEAFQAGDVRRLNLTLQINALEKTVAQWKLSKPPPTPLLDQAAKDLADKRAELARLEAERAGSMATLERERDQALAQADVQRGAYPLIQRALLAEQLRAQDELVLASQQKQLSRQTALLLRQERALAGGTVPASGPVGPLSLPSIAARTGVPGATLERAVRQLQGQRSRWVAFLYDDTQAAAKDAARQRGWQITFDPSHRGETNVTAPLAALLAKSVWKS